MSSRVMPGYSDRSSCSGWPAASCSTRNATARQVPKITGFPAIISGSTVTRSIGGISSVWRAKFEWGISADPAVHCRQASTHLVALETSLWSLVGRFIKKSFDRSQTEIEEIRRFSSFRWASVRLLLSQEIASDFIGDFASCGPGPTLPGDLLQTEREKHIPAIPGDLCAKF